MEGRARWQLHDCVSHRAARQGGACSLAFVEVGRRSAKKATYCNSGVLLQYRDKSILIDYELPIGEE